MMGSECEASSSRKINKPLMEKKRRARINKSLTQLKQILIQDKNHNSQAHAKWEKADILEMTVEYIKSLRQQQQQQQTPTVPPSSSSSTVPQFLPYNHFVQQYLAYQQQLAAFSTSLINASLNASGPEEK